MVDVSAMVGKHNYFKRDVIFHEIDGDTTYSIQLYFLFSLLYSLLFLSSHSL